MTTENAIFEENHAPLLGEQRFQSGPRLQIRDLALLFYTWQCRYIAQRQYREKFWPNSSQSTVSKRLNELIEAKLIKNHALPWLRDRLLYSISTKGTKVLAEAGFTMVPVGDCPKTVADFTPGMKHDLDLVDLRIACERAGHIIDWTCEHELRLARKQGKGSVRIADGFFRFEAFEGEGTGMFEYERMGYRRTKYHDILNRLKASYAYNGGFLVFIVSATAQRAEVLRRWATDSRPWTLTPDRIWFGHYDAIKTGGLAGGFVDLNGLPLRLPKLID